MKLNYKLNSNVVSKLLAYLLIVYTFFLLGKSVWTNFNLKKEKEAMEVKIAEVEKQKENYENLILYYKSDSFREVEARKKTRFEKSQGKR